MGVTVARSLDYDRFSFVQSISMYVFDHIGMVNLHISQVKFDMQILHWIIVKVFYRKPKNWARDDDFDLYLMWELLSGKGFDWVEFILKECFIARRTQAGPCFSHPSFN